MADEEMEAARRQAVADDPHSPIRWPGIYQIEDALIGGDGGGGGGEDRSGVPLVADLQRVNELLTGDLNVEIGAHNATRREPREVPGTLIIQVPLAPPNSGEYNRCRPIALYSAVTRLREKYLRDVWWKS